MRIVIDDETAALLESERAARGLRSPTAANKEIVREAAESRGRAKEREAANEFADRAVTLAADLAAKMKSNLDREIRSLPGRTKKGRAK